MAAARRRRRQSAGSGWDKYGQRIFGNVIAMASTLAGSRKHLAAERLAFAQAIVWALRLGMRGWVGDEVAFEGGHTCAAE